MYPEITNRISKLKEFETQNTPDPRVQEALGIIKSVMILDRRMLIQNNTLAIYYGSLLFNDPRNLDVDLELVETTHRKDAMFNFTDRKNFEFEDIPNWPRTPANNGECSAHLGYTSIQKIEGVIKDFCHKEAEENWKWIPDPNSDEEDEQWDFDRAASNLSLVLTGGLLYPQQQAFHREMKGQVWRLLESYPIIQAPVAKHLQDCIEIREQRRSRL